MQLSNNNKNDWECFNKSIEHIASGEALKKRLTFEGKTIHFKDAVRNDLVHRYFMKVGSGAVAMSSSSTQATRTGFLIAQARRL